MAINRFRIPPSLGPGTITIDRAGRPLPGTADRTPDSDRTDPSDGPGEHHSPLLRVREHRVPARASGYAEAAPVRAHRVVRDNASQFPGKGRRYRNRERLSAVVQAMTRAQV